MSKEKGKMNQRVLLLYTGIGIFVISAIICAYRINANSIPLMPPDESASGYDINDFTVNFTNTAALTNENREEKTSNDEDPQESTVADALLININTASQEELMKLKGIGEVKAAAIIEYRIENGKFNNISEILNVSGIGQKIFEDIRTSITV